ncbi:MAG: FAD-dependent oxidoreductase [Pseudomonadales bacterium]|nr:FAD-dependent oxidoreductase [Pseudomonadales bacterium]
MSFVKAPVQENIVVVGCGISGMCTALALAKRGLSVKVIERDTPPPEGDADKAFFEWPRRGATQFRHPHAFLGLMCNILEENYPDLLEEFYAAGARRVNYTDLLSPELEPQYRPEAGDEKLWMLMCRRATIETVLRRYVESIPNIEVINQLTIDGVITERRGDQLAVAGLKVRRDCQDRFGTEIAADLLVDASGRTTRFPKWFAEAGTEIPEENRDAEIVYYTRHYRLLPGVDEPPRNGKDRAAGDLGYIKFGVFPGDKGNFAVIVCLHTCELELREAIKSGDRFDTVCRSTPGLAPWVAEGKVEPTTEPFGIGDIRAVWRHYVKNDEPLVLNFFAVGDAALRTNPLYGRGCSTSILHAHMLAEVLTEHTDPVQRARVFDRLTEEKLRPIFETSWQEDQNGIRRALAVHEGRVLETPDTFKKRFGMAFGDALAAAARYNLHVHRGMMRTVNLLEKPGAFLEDWRIRMIIFGYMLKGRKRNAAARIQRGPSRSEMLALVGAEVQP